MASVRLNSIIRENICRDLLIHRFRKEINDFVRRQALFAALVYGDVFSSEERKQMGALPDGWLPLSHYIGVQFGGGAGYVQLMFNGRTKIPFLSVRLGSSDNDDRSCRFPARRKGGCCKQYEQWHELTGRHTALRAEGETLLKNIARAKKEAEVALGSVTTVSALIRHWPEVEPFAKAHCPVGDNLPALATQHLNTVFGLKAQPAS